MYACLTMSSLAMLAYMLDTLIKLNKACLSIKLKYKATYVADLRLVGHSCKRRTLRLLRFAILSRAGSISCVSSSLLESISMLLLKLA